MWQEALSTFLQSYLPSTSLMESTHQFSTKEIAAMLEAHTGETVDVPALVKTLNDRGFSSVRTGDLVIEWLMIQQP